MVTENQEYKERIAKGMEGIEDETIPSGGLAEAAQKAGAEVTVATMDYKLETAVTAVINVKPSLDAGVVALFNEATALRDYAYGRKIESLADLKGATGDLNIIRKLKRTLEALRKDWVQPINDHVKAINGDFATLMAPVNDADRVTADKITKYDQEQKRIRQEQEEINRLRIEAAEKEASLNHGEITESVDLIKPVPEVPEYVRTDAGNAGMRDVWKWRVINKSLIPLEYMMVNEGVVTPIVKASKGKITIPGIEQYNEPIIAVRR